MASFERSILEQIAADIIYLSMEYLYEKTYADIIEEVRQASDADIIKFLCD